MSRIHLKDIFLGESVKCEQVDSFTQRQSIHQSNKSNSSNQKNSVYKSNQSIKGSSFYSNKKMDNEGFPSPQKELQCQKNQETINFQTMLHKTASKGYRQQTPVQSQKYQKKSIHFITDSQDLPNRPIVLQTIGKNKRIRNQKKTLNAPQKLNSSHDPLPFQLNIPHQIDQNMTTVHQQSSLQHSQENYEKDNDRVFRYRTQQLVSLSTKNKQLIQCLNAKKKQIRSIKYKNQQLSSQISELSQKQRQYEMQVDKNEDIILKTDKRLQKMIEENLIKLEKQQKIHQKTELNKKQKELQYQEMILKANQKYTELFEQKKILKIENLRLKTLETQNKIMKEKIFEVLEKKKVLDVKQSECSQAFGAMWKTKQRNFIQIKQMIDSICGF